ncbi:hypothetical protein HME9302_01537 [Alteripontixanthobacter maritimus]|uniref:OmpH family outer membrane protein n=1 Tax=Alteripontixanthobacter maritimus TaxID=2161824 RepID=A0A369Q6J9_9SPHN|nr:OmpH family outer membrane protein [Alteripontixanthobacter maritimus]RDC60334.1 hypothetical protein HME9302_01537 [Alteripontixanthobacter maritimus]
MMKFLKPALAAGLAAAALTAPMAMAPAAAQAVTPGIAVVNLPAVVQQSAAIRVAAEQRQTTYKPQIDQANARQSAISAQLQPLYAKLQADQQAGVANAQLQQQAAQIQQIEQAGQRELQTILQPVQLSQAYVGEQIREQLDTAMKAAMAKKNITLLLDASNGAVIYAESPYNITQDIINELNTLLPTAQLVPPAGWLPREIREQQAAAAAAQAQQPTPAPAPTGR